jgi:hypothetical protein
MLRQFSTFNTNILWPNGKVVYKNKTKKCRIEKNFFYWLQLEIKKMCVMKDYVNMETLLNNA